MPKSNETEPSPEAVAEAKRVTEHCIHESHVYACQDCVALALSTRSVEAYNEGVAESAKVALYWLKEAAQNTQDQFLFDMAKTVPEKINELRRNGGERK